MKERQYWVYILSSVSGVLYIGVTNNLERRLWEHRQKKVSGFSAKYNTTRLVRCEEFRYINDAIAREKELKGWRREKKVALINSENPRWRDLAAGWFEE
jgi:putative endonuclease